MDSTENKKVTVIVAGSWGTSLAFVLASNGYRVHIWTRNENQAKEINDKHTNEKYLPNHKLPHHIVATTSLEDALKDSELALFVVPSSAMREIAHKASAYISDSTIVVHATKGFEPTTFKRMSEVLAEELKRDINHIGVLSGPSHAEEVIMQQPTTVVVASKDQQVAVKAQELLMNKTFRVYTNDDVIGIEVAGALKNIIALAAGLINGLQFGDNAKAALLTRGLAEISRLGVAMGANPMTFIGLAGVGDLVVTATSPHSRNWRAGFKLASGSSLDEVLSEMGMVVEGVKTTRAAFELAKLYDIDMPITEQLYEVLFLNRPLREAVNKLMSRDKTYEMR